MPDTLSLQELVVMLILDAIPITTVQFVHSGIVSAIWSAQTPKSAFYAIKTPIVPAVTLIFHLNALFAIWEHI